MRKGTTTAPDTLMDTLTRPQRATDGSESGFSDSTSGSDHQAPFDVDVIDVATRVAMVRQIYPLETFFDNASSGGVNAATIIRVI